MRSIGDRWAGVRGGEAARYYGALRIYSLYLTSAPIRCVSGTAPGLARMRQPMTIRLEADILAAAKRRAAGDNRTLTNYIETLVPRDLSASEQGFRLEVIAPADIRDYEPVPIDGESAERHDFRRRLFSAILDEAAIDGAPIRSR